MRRSYRRLLSVAGAVALGGVSACSVLVSLDGLSGDAAVSDTREGGGDATATGSIDAFLEQEVHVEAGSVYTLFSDLLPVTPVADDLNAIEVGVKFTVTTPGEIQGIRFYRAVANPQGYVVHLWGSGILLASAPVPPDGPDPGWREQRFAPVAVVPGKIYITSYITSNGAYAATQGGLASDFSKGPLTALASASVGGNGVYDYGDGSVAPASTFEANNYFADVLFVPTK